MCLYSEVHYDFPYIYNNMENRIISQIEEATNSPLGGSYTSPLKNKIRKWKDYSLKPFLIDVSDSTDPEEYVEDLDEKEVVKEDLGVWFGTKKKPKGSSQPKGPWVNICRKDKNGKHPPCGRKEADDSAYPKCRAAGVAGKMTDSQKKSACQQKRQAEKTHNKSGTGNKPKMVKYVPKKDKKLNEIISRVLEEYINNGTSF